MKRLNKKKDLGVTKTEMQPSITTSSADERGTPVWIQTSKFDLVKWSCNAPGCLSLHTRTCAILFRHIYTWICVRSDLLFCLFRVYNSPSCGHRRRENQHSLYCLRLIAVSAEALVFIVIGRSGSEGYEFDSHCRPGSFLRFNSRPMMSSPYCATWDKWKWLYIWVSYPP